MAAITPSNTSRTLQQTLLKLDSADVPFSMHLAEASKIIGFDIEDTQGLSKERAFARSSFTPREEWILRWLLKKLQSSGYDSESACLEPKAWRLLQELLRGVPLSNAARLLSTHGFTTILRETLEWLVQAGKSGLLGRGMLQDAHAGASHDDSDMNRSSSTILESPSSHTVRKSRKRKREGTMFTGQPAMTGLHRGGYADGGLLYEALCGALSQVIHLTEARPGDIRDFASEHMRAVLRISPDEAAEVLGSSMCMLSWRIKQRTTLLEGRIAEPLEPSFMFLSPMVALWDLRSGTADDLAGQASNHAFSAQCLMPALHLLSQFEAVKHDAFVSTTTHVLEQLIARNLILPARAAWLESIHPGKPRDNRTAAPLTEELFHPLQLGCSRELEEDVLQGTRGPFTGTLEMIPVLFTLIIKCTSLNTIKRRTAEMPWLQYIFVYLARCASIPIFLATSSQPAEVSLRVLEDMLEIAITSELCLDASILENLLSEHSGLVSKELSEVNWALVGLCLKLDPNIFIMPSSNRDKGKIPLTESGSEFLAPLLARITSVGLRTLQEVPSLYRTILSEIVLPLVAAFAHTRRLLYFIEHWQEQLRICADAQHISIADLTIWEDEELLHLVSRLLEPSLTTMQIGTMFHAAYVDLEKRFAVGADNIGAVAWVSSVIIECIVDGCPKETVTDKLSRTAQMVYYLTMRILHVVPYQVTKFRWRLWRVAASIRSHWPGVSIPGKVSDTESAVESGALAKALQTFLKSTGSVWSPQGYIERLQAFKFILSFASAVRRIGIETSSPHEIEIAIEWVINSLKDELEQIDTKRNPWWDGTAVTATSQDVLLIGCVTLLILLPKALSCCNSNLQTGFFSILSMCAWQQERLHSIHKPTTIRYPWLWQKLLQSELLQNESSSASCLRKVQVTEYQELTENGGDDLSESRQRFCAKGLLNTSMDLLGRRQRALISNCTLQNLLEHHSTMSEQQLADYVCLLARTAETPSKSLELCTESSTLWSLAGVFNGTKTIPNSSGLTSLRRLTDVTLNHLISTASEGKSAEYLRTFYDLLHEKLSKTKSFEKTPGLSVLICQSTALFQRRWDVLSQMLKRGKSTFTNLRQTHFDILLRDLHMYERELDGVFPAPSNAERWNFGLGIILDSLVEYTNLFDARPFVTTFAMMWLDTLDERIDRSLSESVKLSEPSIPQDTITPSIELLLAKMDRLNASVAQRGSISSERLHQVIRLLESLCTPLSKRRVLCNFKASMENLNPNGKADLLASLIGGDGWSIITDARLLLFQGVVASIEDSSQNARVVVDSISHSVGVLIDQLARTKEFRNYVLTAQCLDLVLQKKSWAVSQWHTDGLLCAITKLTLPSAPLYGREHAGLVYTSLCRLYGTVLASHRTKIGGRYHLVVPALQGLMRCLFITHGRNGGSAAVLSLPPWLNGREPMLDGTHAAGFARLLTTICDPTVSSVTRSKNRSRRELNDDTKKARGVAGQHLPYIIMVYCHCHLKGRLLPTVKAALTPGLYAVFDVMSQDTLRTLNAAMDSSSRAIFKALYDDYRRFGRWERA